MALFPNETRELLLLNDVCNVENSIFIFIRLVLQLTKAVNVFAVLQTWSED